MSLINNLKYMGTEVKDRTADEQDLVEKALENNKGDKKVLEEAGIINTTAETKDNLEKINLEKPINNDNIEVGDGVSAETVTHILTKNFTVKNHYLMKCSDDRTPDKGLACNYNLGGTQGMLQVLFSVVNKINDKQIQKKHRELIREILVKTIGGEDNYYYHSDNHNINDPKGCGCGALNTTLNPTNKDICAIKPEGKKFLASKRAQNKEKTEILEGEHAAKGIIFIHDKNISCIPKGKKGGYFIYNYTAIEKIFSEFIENINKETNFNIDKNFALEELLNVNMQILIDLGGGDLPLYHLKNKGNNTYKLNTDGTMNDAKKEYYLSQSS